MVDISIAQYTDEMLKRAFLSRFTKFMDKANAYIHEKLLLAPDYVLDPAIQSTNIIAETLQQTALITDHAAILARICLITKTIMVFLFYLILETLELRSKSYMSVKF